ncbi:MAG TPA: ferritin-like domain-containing protein [Longimicrobiales bacterium]
MANDARQSLVDGLNEDLAHEYQAIISYLLYSRLVNGALRPELSAFFEREIDDELEHAKLLSRKIVALGGEPTTRPAAVRLSEDNRAMVEMALQDERDTIARYTRRIEQAEEAGEVGLRVELENVVAEETKHRDDLERILSRWSR